MKRFLVIAALSALMVVSMVSMAFADTTSTVAAAATSIKDEAMIGFNAGIGPAAVLIGVLLAVGIVIRLLKRAR